MEFLGVGNVQSEDFSVDDLLNFTYEDVVVREDEEQSHDESKCEQNRGLCCSVSGETGALIREESSMEISFPADDDLADLEWLSEFVDDSFDFPEQLPEVLAVKPINRPHENNAEPEADSLAKVFFNTPVPVKARSKRGRTGSRVWSLHFGPFSASPSRSGSFSSSGSQGSDPLVKKHKRNISQGKEALTGLSTQPVRRCSHCGVQKTPQWRAGPMGAKTLCNACGVRFKSGRLFPEYRPACSPTFHNELHSNHHRKVLEMRRKKELPHQPQPLPITSGFLEGLMLGAGLVDQKPNPGPISQV